MEKGKKILGVVLNIVIWLIILLAVFITIITLNTKERKVADLFGFIPLSVQTDSMKPTINPGDLIITKEYDGTSLLEKGDIISFFSLTDDTIIIKTHRIDEVHTNNGSPSYITKGDNVDEVDELEVVPGDIVSTYSGTKLPVMGKVLTFLQSQIGFFVFIILPLFAFFIYQLYKFISVIIDSKREVAKE